MGAVRHMPLRYIPQYFIIKIPPKQDNIHRVIRGSGQLWYFREVCAHCHTRDWKTGTGIKGKIMWFITATTANG